MPLSEHEQRILAELEESLSKQDPRFAKNVRETNVYSHGGRRVRWGIAGFIAGLVILILCFSTSVLLGLVGVALMLSLIHISTLRVLHDDHAPRLSIATGRGKACVIENRVDDPVRYRFVEERAD